MIKSMAQIFGELFHNRKRLLARFVITSLGRAFTSMAVIFFIREFLARTADQHTGFGDAVGASLGTNAVLWLAAGMLLATYLVGSLFFYDNHIVVQRIIKVIELGFMERVIRHLLKLSVPYADHQSHGEIIQTIRTDVTQMRMVVQAVAQDLPGGHGGGRADGHRHLSEPVVIPLGVVGVTDRVVASFHGVAATPRTLVGCTQDGVCPV